MLHREPAYYPTLRTILVYPSSYLATHPHDGEKNHRLGESWQFGPGVLAWDSSLRGGKNAFDGHNVVMHEFAHQLDQMDGAADGAPTLGQEARDAILLRYHSELTVPEIARALGWREGTVKSRLHRAQNRLRELLDEEPAAKAVQEPIEFGRVSDG